MTEKRFPPKWEKEKRARGKIVYGRGGGIERALFFKKIFPWEEKALLHAGAKRRGPNILSAIEKFPGGG